MKKILFPTEFSDHAPDVFGYALEIAKRFKATIVVMHALGIRDTPLMQGKKAEDRSDAVMDKLLDLVKENKTTHYDDVKIEYVVDVDYPTSAIEKIASQEAVGLIVMGMTGKSKTIQSLFGSVTSSVLESAAAPVLLVPAGQKYRWFQNIIYATDFTFGDIGVLNYLKKLAKVFNTEIDCIHVVEKGEDRQAAKVKMSMLAEAYEGRYFADFDVLGGETIEAISEYLRYDTSNILVLLTQKKSIWSSFVKGSLTKEMIEKISRPILVFKETQYEDVGWNIDLSLED